MLSASLPTSASLMFAKMARNWLTFIAPLVSGTLPIAWRTEREHPLGVVAP